MFSVNKPDFNGFCLESHPALVHVVKSLLQHGPFLLRLCVTHHLTARRVERLKRMLMSLNLTL